jgi:cytochrome c
MKACIATLASLLLGCILASTVAPGNAAGLADPARGKEAFDKRCAGCHGLDRIKEGPKLRNVYGQRAATTPGFPYSEALKRARLTWDDVTLDKWLQNPENLAPDNDMSTRVPDSTDRANIIAYLKMLGASQNTSSHSQR